MGSVQINEDLLANSAYFAADSRRAALAEMFEFRDRRVTFGAGALSQLADECVRLGAGRVLLIHDPGIAPLVDLVRQALRRLGRGGHVQRDRAQPFRAERRCLRAHALAVADFDVAVALGGGSTMDTAKSALCTAANGGSVADYFGFDLYEKPPLVPLVGIPTTAGTGSEVSRVAVIADATGKKAVYSSYLQPKAALVDPRLHQRPTASIDRDHWLRCPSATPSNARLPPRAMPSATP